MKRAVLPGLVALGLVTGCAHNPPPSPDGGSTAPEGEAHPVKAAARVAIMKVASTPVKVVTAAGTVAKKVEEKVEGDNPPQ